MIRTNFTAWDSQLSSLPSPALLQTSSWARVKEHYGWKSIPIKWEDENSKVIAMALVLKRQIQIGRFKLPISMLYIPKGPILDWEDQELVHLVLKDLAKLAKDENAFLIKIEPEIPQFIVTNDKEPEEKQLTPFVSTSFMVSEGWVFSNNQIQFRNSVLIDLKRSEDEILAEMKQKTRYNIRLSSRKGVVVEEGTAEDFETLYQLYAETSVRDGFVIRSKDYYLTVWETFYQEGQLTPLIAKFDGVPLAGLLLFHFHKTAYYIYGMSTNLHRNLMPTYLLQWEAIRKGKALGCEVYDLWGAPNTLTEEDDMWGVYRFKLGLGGTTVGTIGAWDNIRQPLVFKLYNEVMPKILTTLRKRRKEETAQEL